MHNVFPTPIRPGQDEEGEIERIQKELAEMSIRNGLLQISSWNADHVSDFVTMQPPEVRDDVLPRVREEDFERYMQLIERKMDLYIPTLSKAGDGGKLEGFSGMEIEEEHVPGIFYDGLFELDSQELWDELERIHERQCEMDGWETAIERLLEHKKNVERQLLEEISKRYDRFCEGRVKMQDVTRGIRSMTEKIQMQKKKTGGILEETQWNACLSIKAKTERRNLEVVLDVCQKLLKLIYMKDTLETLMGSSARIGCHHREVAQLLLEFRHMELECSALLEIHSYQELKDTVVSIEEEFEKIMISDLEKEVHMLFTLESVDDAPPPIDTGTAVDVLESDEHDMKQMGFLIGCYIDIFQSDDLRIHLHKSVKGVIGEILWTFFSSMADEEIREQFPSTSVTAELCHASFVSSRGIIPKMCLSIVHHIVNTAERIDSMELFPESTMEHMGSLVGRAARTVLSYWSQVMIGWSLAAKELQLGASNLENILHITKEISATCESQGINATAMLSGSIQEACRAVIDTITEDLQDKLQNAMLQDRWKHIEISQDAQNEVNVLTGKRYIFNENDHKVTIREQKFGLTASSVAFLKILAEMKTMALRFPSFLPEISHRVMESLRQYNSRLCQLVLGAGAMHSAGLKSISVKHLAISYEQICIFAEIIPELCEFFVGGAESSRKLLVRNEYGRLQKDMRLHCQEISQKITAIALDKVIPLMKEACRLLSRIATEKHEYDGLNIGFTNAIDSMVGSLEIVKSIAADAMSKEQSNKVIDSVVDQSLVWLRDSIAILKAKGITTRIIILYQDHVDYLLKKLDPVPPTLLLLKEELGMMLEQIVERS